MSFWSLEREQFYGCIYRRQFHGFLNSNGLGTQKKIHENVKFQLFDNDPLLYRINSMVEVISVSASTYDFQVDELFDFY